VRNNVAQILYLKTWCSFTGVSDCVVSAMIAFSAKDLSGEQFGASFYLSAAGGFVSFIQHFIQKKSTGKFRVSQPAALTDAKLSTSNNRQAEIVQSFV